MKNILKISAIAVMAFFMSCAPSTEKTVVNLKAAIDGESSASANYAKFSAKAAEDSLFNVARMFAATSYAESLHAAKHLEELAKLGVTDYKATITEAPVKSTLENLEEAKAGEIYEFTEMYPGFMATAVAEKANGALISFEWAKIAEDKHSQFYGAAIEALNNPEIGDAGFTAAWAVCSKCGDTYMLSEVGEACKLCATPAAQFKIFQ